MASRKKEVATEFAECALCGDRMTPSDEEMMFHVATRHPMELMKHPKVAPALQQMAFAAGSALANLFRGNHGQGT